MIKSWFEEFMADQHPEVDVQRTIFALGSPLPDIVLMKEYARYMARSRVGKLENRISVRTLQGYMEFTVILLKYQAEWKKRSAAAEVSQSVKMSKLRVSFLTIRQMA